MINDLRVYLGDENVRLLGQRGIAARSEAVAAPVSPAPSPFEDAPSDEDDE
jgi:hypothetical protein